MLDLMNYTKYIMSSSENNIMKLFGENVKYYRNLANLTQFELSEKIGRTEESISNIERGISTAKIDILVDLSKTLGIEIDDLFQENHHKKIKKENITLIRNILGNIKQKDTSFLNMILSHLQNLEKNCKK